MLSPGAHTAGLVAWNTTVAACAGGFGSYLYLYGYLKRPRAKGGGWKNGRRTNYCGFVGWRLIFVVLFSRGFLGFSGDFLKDVGLLKQILDYAT